MSFLQNIKSFLFGSTNRNSTEPNIPDRQHPQLYCDEDPVDEDFATPDGFPRNFDVFTDPLKMHQYFEQQINEMLQNFGFSNFGSHSFFDNFQTNPPQLEDINPNVQPETNDLRDHFLKKGYEKPNQRALHDKVDKDIDNELQISDFDTIFKQQQTPAPKSFFHGQSMSTKTVRHSDGSMETHTTVRDNEGNEQVTVRKVIGDKEVSITKKRNKNGQEEIIENLINVDENEKNKFLPNPF